MLLSRTAASPERERTTLHGDVFFKGKDFSPYSHILKTQNSEEYLKKQPINMYSSTGTKEDVKIVVKTSNGGGSMIGMLNKGLRKKQKKN